MRYPRLLIARVLLLAAVVFALAGCGGAPPLHPPKQLTQLPSPGYRMQVLWKASAGSGSGGQVSGFGPAVSGDTVFVAGGDGDVTALDIDSGKRQWQTDVDKPLIAGPAVDNGVVIVATQNGSLEALSADDGQPMWHKQLSSEVIAAPAISNDIAVVRTLDGRVIGLDADSGNRRWTVQRSEPKLTVRGASSPVIVNKTVYVGMDSGKVLALDLDNGRNRWTQTVAVPAGRSELDRIVDIDANLIVTRNIVYAISAGKQLVALSARNGAVGWRQQIASTAGLAFDGGQLFTVKPNGTVVAVGGRQGDIRWQQKAFDYRQVSAPAVFQGDVLVGDYQGYLHWLSADDGDEIARGQPFDSAIRIAPKVADGRIIVQSESGAVAAVKFVPSGG